MGWLKSIQRIDQKEMDTEQQVSLTKITYCFIFITLFFIGKQNNVEQHPESHIQTPTDSEGQMNSQVPKNGYFNIQIREYKVKYHHSKTMLHSQT